MKQLVRVLLIPIHFDDNDLDVHSLFIIDKSNKENKTRIMYTSVWYRISSNNGTTSNSRTLRGYRHYRGYSNSSTVSNNSTLSNNNSN